LISGTVVGPKNEVLNNVSVTIHARDGEHRAATDDRGQFHLAVPNDEEVQLHVEGQYIKPLDQTIKTAETSGNLRIEIEYLIPPIHQSLVITASGLEPRVETRSDEVYKRTLFSRDDKLL
jgi:hypothetical protein